VHQTFVFGVPIVLYYLFVGPYVAQLQQTYGQLQGGVREMEQAQSKMETFPQWVKETLQSRGLLPGATSATTSTSSTQEKK
jgi:hypothetical protein